MIAETGAEVDWVFAGSAEEGHGAGAGPEGGVVEAGAVLFGAFVPVAVEGEVDESGVVFGKLLVGELEGFLASGYEVGGEDVGPGGELVDGLLGPGSGEVESHGALATVVHLEGVADGERRAEVGVPDLGAEGVALEGLDLYNVGAHVGHHGAAGGYGEPVGDFEDSDAFQGRFHVTASGEGELGE